LIFTIDGNQSNCQDQTVVKSGKILL